MQLARLPEPSCPEAGGPDGHDHGYERFAPQTPLGVADPRHGVREFVLGTGGKSLFGNAKATAPNSQLYNDTAFGVTLFTLHDNRHEWTFYPERADGNPQFTDHGDGRCNTREIPAGPWGS